MECACYEWRIVRGGRIGQGGGLLNGCHKGARSKKIEVVAADDGNKDDAGVDDDGGGGGGAGGAGAGGAGAGGAGAGAGGAGGGAGGAGAGGDVMLMMMPVFP
jgi:hypothetical protein